MGLINKILGITLFALIVGFVVSVLFSIINGIFTNEPAYTGTIISAFAGAFFAFIFIRLSDILTRYYDRKKIHFNALVLLQHTCNDYLTVFDDNLFLVRDFKEKAEKIIDKNMPIIYPSKFLKADINKKIQIDLSNLDLINKLVSFNTNLFKMNTSIDTLNSTYESINTSFAEEKLNFEGYKQNVQFILSKTQELDTFLEKGAEEAIEIFATARVLCHDMPFLTWLLKALSRNSLSSSQAKKIEKEIPILKEEISNKNI